MRLSPSTSEMILLALCTALLAVAIWAPPANQPAHYHAFADQRVLWGVPHAMNVLSNLSFAAAGLLGAVLLYLVPFRALGTVQRAMAALFFGGLMLTAAGSTWYHLHPDDAGLAMDRLGMAACFAGVLGLIGAGRVSERAGARLGLALLLLGPLAVRVWTVSGNVMPWAALQFGGLALVLWMTLLTRRDGALPVRWGFVIAAYAAAKLLELHDHEVYEFTGQWVSGHTLKHVVASLAALPVITAIGRLALSGQNAAGNAARTGDAARGAGHA